VQHGLNLVDQACEQALLDMASLGRFVGMDPGYKRAPDAKLRLVLDVQVNSGKQHTSMHAKTALGRLLDELGDGPDSRGPALVRGDSGYGNEGILLELESRNQPYGVTT
jgi:hypothetical protein